MRFLPSHGSLVKGDTISGWGTLFSVSQSLSPRVERDGGVAVATCIGTVMGIRGLPSPALIVQKGEEAWQVGSRWALTSGGM